MLENKPDYVRVHEEWKEYRKMWANTEECKKLEKEFNEKSKKRLEQD